jgi:uncharacterized protein with FMN-binding domain
MAASSHSESASLAAATAPLPTTADGQSTATQSPTTAAAIEPTVAATYEAEDYDDEEYEDEDDEDEAEDYETAAATEPTAAVTSPATATQPATETATTARWADGTYVGAAGQTPWGPVQVQVTISNGAIADVSAVAYPTDRKSGRINSQAIPILQSDALQNQTAALDTVSGATWTSTRYSESLQSALDSAASAAQVSA